MKLADLERNVVVCGYW